MKGWGGACSKRTPAHLQHQCPHAARQGRGSSVARQGWKEDSAAECHSLGSSAHLLQQTQKLQAAGCPSAAWCIFSFPCSQLLTFSPDFLGVPKQREQSGLSTMAWKQLLANLQVPAVSHLQTSYMPHAGMTW